MAMTAYNVYKAASGGFGVSTSFLARTRAHTGNRSMFNTANLGIVGLAPRGSIMGDAVVIFEGGNVPFIIRPKGQDNSWEIIAACYLHGCMHGQLFQLERCTPMVIM
jgi:hypothetical protein